MPGHPDPVRDRVQDRAGAGLPDRCVPECRTETYTCCVTKCVPYQATRCVTVCVPHCVTEQVCRMVPKCVTKQVPCCPPACPSPCAPACHDACAAPACDPCAAPCKPKRARLLDRLGGLCNRNKGGDCCPISCDTGCGAPAASCCN